MITIHTHTTDSNEQGYAAREKLAQRLTNMMVQQTEQYAAQQEQEEQEYDPLAIEKNGEVQFLQNLFDHLENAKDSLDNTNTIQNKIQIIQQVMKVPSVASAQSALKMVEELRQEYPNNSDVEHVYKETLHALRGMKHFSSPGVSPAPIQPKAPALPTPANPAQPQQATRTAFNTQQPNFVVPPVEIQQIPTPTADSRNVELDEEIVEDEPLHVERDNLPEHPVFDNPSRTAQPTDKKDKESFWSKTRNFFRRQPQKQTETHDDDDNDDDFQSVKSVDEAAEEESKRRRTLFFSDDDDDDEQMRQLNLDLGVEQDKKLSQDYEKLRKTIFGDEEEQKELDAHLQRAREEREKLLQNLPQEEEGTKEKPVDVDEDDDERTQAQAAQSTASQATTVIHTLQSLGVVLTPEQLQQYSQAKPFDASEIYKNKKSEPESITQLKTKLVDAAKAYGTAKEKETKKKYIGKTSSILLEMLKKGWVPQFNKETKATQALKDMGFTSLLSTSLTGQGKRKSKGSKKKKSYSLSKEDKEILRYLSST